MVNFACLLKLLFSCWKCLQTIIALNFSHLFDDYSVLYKSLFLLFLNIAYFIKCMTWLLAQSKLWNIFNSFLVCWLSKVVVSHACLQQSDLKFVRHGDHLPGFSFCTCLLSTLFFSVLLLPINSLRLLFHLNDVIGWQLSISFRDLFITNKFQCFRIILLIFGKKYCKLMLVVYVFVLAFP